MNRRLPARKSFYLSPILVLAGITSVAGAQLGDAPGLLWDRGESPAVVATSPKGGESLLAGATHTLSWTIGKTRRPVAKIRIDLSLNGGKRWQRVTTLSTQPGEGSIPTARVWSIPAVAKTQRKCLIRVTLKDKQGRNLGKDSSDSFFTIKPNTDTAVHEEISSGGGVLSAEDSRGNVITLTLPPGALTEATLVSLTVLKKPPGIPVGVNIFSGVMIEPHGLVLTRPATLEVSFAKRLSKPALSRLFWVHSEEVIVAIADQKETRKKIIGEIHHFSTYSGRKTKSVEELWRIADKHDLVEILYGQFPWLDVYIDTYDLSQGQLELSKMAEVLGNTDVSDEMFDGAMGALEQGALQFLGTAVPADPCGRYRSFAYKMQGLIGGLGDDVLSQRFRDHVVDLEEQSCVMDMSGQWTVVPIAGSQTCRSGDSSWVEDEGSPESWLVHLVQDRLLLTATYPDLPAADPVEGQLMATGNEVEPFTFNLSTVSSATPDCILFFESNGRDTVFGSNLCNVPGNRCVPLSCQETTTDTGNVNADGTSALIVGDWTIRFRYQEVSPEGDSVVQAVTCDGNMETVATRGGGPTCDALGFGVENRAADRECEEKSGLEYCVDERAVLDEALMRADCRATLGSHNEKGWPLASARVKEIDGTCPENYRLMCKYCEFTCV